MNLQNRYSINENIYLWIMFFTFVLRAANLSINILIFLSLIKSDYKLESKWRRCDWTRQKISCLQTKMKVSICYFIMPCSKIVFLWFFVLLLSFSSWKRNFISRKKNFDPLPVKEPIIQGNTFLLIIKVCFEETKFCLFETIFLLERKIVKIWFCFWYKVVVKWRFCDLVCQYKLWKHFLWKFYWL